MDWKPLYISLGLIFSIGILLPLIMSSFIVEEEFETNNILINGLVSVIDDGVNIFTFNLNVFNFLGETLKENLINYVKSFAYIPLILLIPLLIFTITGIVYTIIKMLPTT